MSIQLKTTRVRPSITINPRGVILLKEYRYTHRLNVENEITLRIEEYVKYHLDKMNDTQTVFKKGVHNHDYEKLEYYQGNDFFKAAYVCAVIEKNINMGLFWLRKAWAAFEFCGKLVIYDEDNEYSYVWLLTDVMKQYDWSICASVYTRSILGELETTEIIGTITEVPDVKSSTLRAIQFDNYVKEQMKEWAK